GLVSGAVFSDLDGDGAPDLVLACDWGPLRLFHNAGGRLQPWDPPVRFAGASVTNAGAPRPPPATLSQMKGWWNGVATGDFDGDGRLDILAANWGRNTKYEGYRAQPLRARF